MLFKNEQDYQTQRQALLAKVEGLIAEGKTDGANKVMDNEIKVLDDAFEDYKTAKANFNALNGQRQPMPEFGNSAKMGGENTRGEMLNSEEYRKAFMNHVLKGEAIPAKFLNTDAQTTSSEVAAVIPTILVQEIIKKFKKYGKFYAMVGKTHYKGGVVIPVSELDLEATWVGEGNTGDAQEAPVGSVTFAYHKLTCKVRLSFEASVLTLDIFEASFTEDMAQAMVKKIERAIFNGLGNDSHQPKGFLTETPVSGQKIEITEGNDITYADLAEAEGALPEEYEDGAIWVMPKKTYYGQVVGMVDDNGQPVTRLNIGADGKPERTILGRKVEFAPYMSAFSKSVSADTTVAAIFDFSRYKLNENYEMMIKKYTDEDTDDQIKKALMLLDGKTVDKNSLVTVVVKNS